MGAPITAADSLYLPPPHGLCPLSVVAERALGGQPPRPPASAEGRVQHWDQRRCERATRGGNNSCRLIPTELRVCSVTVAAVRLKEAWLRGPEGNRRPEPPSRRYLQAVGVKTVMYWSLNKISVYGDRVHGEAVPVSSQLICTYE